MYTAKMSRNSVLGDRIRFILGPTFETTHNYLGTNNLPCQRRLPIATGLKNSGLYDQFDHIL